MVRPFPNVNVQPSTRPRAKQRRLPADPPVEVDSFASGVTSPTLKAILNEAEAAMKRGQYVQSVARYDAAARLVPNQPLVLLGRGTAELGAGFYRRSASTLRAALERHPELAMGRVSVIELLGAERVETLRADLEQLAMDQPDSPVPTFLLAYLVYGEGDATRAARLLRVADVRNGGQDTFYSALAQIWSPEAPATRPATQPAALTK
jgi:tetratricopeptide (TPR) repeat protein